MSDRLRKTIIFTSLALALAWAMFTYAGKKTPSLAPLPVEPAPAIQSHVDTNARPAMPDLEAKRNTPWGRDPFRTSAGRGTTTPRSVGEDAPLAWELAGIVYNHLQPIALINDQMVGVGDRVGTATVVAIERTSVTLEYQGRQIKLTLSKG